MVSPGCGSPFSAALAFGLHGARGHRRHGSLSERHARTARTRSPSPAPAIPEGSQRGGSKRMSRSEPDSLVTLTQSFFLNYLRSTRGASSHTIRADRDALKLFFLFLAGHKRKTIEDLDLDDVQAEAVLKFLDHIESKRSNSAVTRNCRLAASVASYST